MPTMKIDEIQIDERFRQEFGDLDDLAESIKKYGLIHPPVVDENGTLIAGERRFRACQLLGMEEIEVRRLGDLSQLERKEIELEENLHRKQFTWAEEVRAKRQIHIIKQIQEGERVKGHESDGWGVKDTAEALDESLGTVSQDIKLAKALDENPELEKCKNKSEAWKKLKEKEERQILKAMAGALGSEKKSDLYEIHRDDILTWIKDQPDESFDLVIADPPWGIGMDTKSRLSREKKIEYDDTLQYAFDLVKKSTPEFYRVLKPGSHMYMYFGISHKDLFEQIIIDAGFEVCSIPLIYNKNRGGSAAKGKTFPNAYETIFFCWKGSREINITHHNVFTVGRPEGKKRIHSAQKPIKMQDYFVRASTDPGDRILVPFMGSGSAVVAAVKGQRFAVGVEKSKENYANAVNWIQENLEEV